MTKEFYPVGEDFHISLLLFLFIVIFYCHGFGRDGCNICVLMISLFFLSF